MHGGDKYSESYSTDLWRFDTSTRGWELVKVTNGTAPGGREKHVMTSVGRDLWLHGGSTGSGRSSELWRFDTSTRGWEAVVNTVANGAVPSARAGHVMTSVGLGLWLHGGWDFLGYTNAEMWWFDTSTRGWQRVDHTTANGAAPSGRSVHVMTSVGLDLWLHGGTTDVFTPDYQFVPVFELWRFDTSTRGWERVDTTVNGTAPSARCMHVMTSVGLDLWMHGGQTDSGKSAELWRFDTSTRGWERVDTTVNGTAPSARDDHVMTSVGLDLWLHGGSTGSGRSSELWRFDTSTRGWEAVVNTVANGAVPSARASHVMTSVGLGLLLHGGLVDADSVLSAELWRFDTSRREWEVGENTVQGNGVSPSVRFGHVMTSVGGMDLWLHGGQTTYPSESSNAHRCSTHAAPLLLHRDTSCISLYLVPSAAAAAAAVAAAVLTRTCWCRVTLG
jgi:hypothetical protein